MKAPTPASQERRKERRIEAERLLLAALCQQTLGVKARETVLRHLARHEFAHPEHQVIFQVLSPLPARQPAMIREVLTTRLTVSGFPDLDLSAFFDTQPPVDVEIPGLLQLL